MTVVVEVVWAPLSVWAAAPTHITRAASSTTSAGQSAAMRVVRHAPRVVCCVRPLIMLNAKRSL